MLCAESRARDFPSLRGVTYLNTAAEGIPPRAVGEALAQYFRDKLMGMDGRDAHFAQWEAARELVGQAFGLSAAEVSICSSSSEAFNLAALALRLHEGDEVVINDLDFPAGATPWLQNTCPAAVRVWRHRQGALRVEDLVDLLRPTTRLVTVSLVSFFNGFMLNLAEVAATVRRHAPALLAVDVTQALGRVPLSLTGADLVVSSTHKWILASHGGGLVGVPKARAAEWTVPAGGWFNLEDAFGPTRFERAVSRPGAASFTVGMPNFPAVYALQAALGYIQQIGVPAIDRAARPLVLACLDELKKLPIELLTPAEPDHLAGILAFRHPKADEIHRRLHERQIHVMSHAGRLRVALHGYNAMEDVEKFLRELVAAINGA
ncbi:MAG TPA: aminotransferase class V-fold PLP-dependent enzyme [Pirellulales bacterium]|jgi:selenocysteine lyase/cysteine desulfurase|nr:aminotransferase class V-fold PLP-dependent enzyme [Pirellulales bacterium]